MSLCLAAGGTILALAVEGFTLSWTHSVERTAWWERWEVVQAGLRPVAARIMGAGAGMEAPPGAVLKPDGWHYVPDLPPQREVLLAASGATGGGWQFCAGGTCRELGADPGEPVRLWQAARCEAGSPD